MKKVILLCGLCLFYLGFMTNSCEAQTDGFSLQSRFGVGMTTSVINFGIGPSVEFWPTENIGILGSFTSLFDYTSYGGRVDYLFSQPIYAGSSPNKVYIGVGYVIMQGPEQSGGAYGYTWKVEQEGSGIEAHAGILHQANYLTDKLFFRGEFIYYAFDLETKGSSNFGYETSVDLDWNTFTIGLGVHYLF